MYFSVSVFCPQSQVLFMDDVFSRISQAYLYTPHDSRSVGKNMTLLIFMKKNFKKRKCQTPAVQTYVCPNRGQSNPLFVRTSDCPNHCGK